MRAFSDSCPSVCLLHRIALNLYSTIIKYDFSVLRSLSTITATRRYLVPPPTPC